MKRFLIILMLLFPINMGIFAQSIQRQGNTFVQTSKSKESKDTQTKYIYKDSKGISYSVYLSAKGKAFIWKTSSKTNKKYRYYIPDVGKQINPSAYTKE